MRTYAIGDIHGQLDLLRAAHGRIARDRAETGDTEAPVVHVGDLVDRGPDSRGVLEWLIAGHARGENWVTLKGNHDRMFALFLDDPLAHDPGLIPDLGYLNPRIGGDETLASYGVRHAADRPIGKVHAEAVRAVPQAHRDFIARLPTTYRRGDALFVHAGIRPGIPLERQTETDLVWIRKGFLDRRDDFGVFVVHGHTAIDAATHYGNRVDIDSKAAYGGPLTAVAVEGRSVFRLGERGRERLAVTPDAPVR